MERLQVDSKMAKLFFRQVRDLSLNLKIEKRDHQLTKKELLDTKKQLQELEENQNENLKSRLESIRNEYIIQIEQLRS